MCSSLPAGRSTSRCRNSHAAADLHLRRLQALRLDSGPTGAGTSPTAISSCFSAFYVVGAMADRADARHRSSISACAAKRSGAPSFSIRSPSRSWSRARCGAGSTAPTTGIEILVRSLGWRDFTFRLTTHRDMAIYAIVITGIWQSSGFVMALFLAGLRSVDPDLVKAAQIDGAGRAASIARLSCRRSRPIFVAVLVVLLQFAIKTFDLVIALTGGGPGHFDDLPGDLCLRSHVPARPDRRRRRGRDHDPGGARRGAGALYALDRLAPAPGGRPWLTRPSTCRIDSQRARREPARRADRPLVVYGLLTLFALIYLLPLFVVVAQFLPRPAGDHAERPDRLAAQLFARMPGRRPGSNYCVGGTCEGVKRNFFNSLSMTFRRPSSRPRSAR